MRHTHLFPLLLLACTTTPKEDQADVPVAFQGPSLVTEIKQVGSRSGYGRDLVEELFAEALSKDSALANLVSDIDERAEQFNVSASAFRAFEANNAQYHGSAAGHLEQVRDTLLRAPMKLELQQHASDFDRKVAGQRSSLDTYHGIEQRSEDLLELIKLKRSLAMVKTYQKEHWPDAKVLEQEVERMKELQARLEATLAIGN